MSRKFVSIIDERIDWSIRKYSFYLIYDTICSCKTGQPVVHDSNPESLLLRFQR